MNLSCFFHRFGMGKSFNPSCQNWQIFEPLSCFFSDFGMGEFLKLSHTSVTYLRWANFLTPLAKTNKFLKPLMLLSQIWDEWIFEPLSCFFHRFRIGKFFNSSCQNWQIFKHLSCFFYRFGIRISIDQSSYTSVNNSRTFPFNQRSCWHFWLGIVIKNSNWSIFLHIHKKFTNLSN